MKFYLIDDDIAIIKMLQNIIIENNLGEIVGFNLNGHEAINEIIKFSPDIILIDYLMPLCDGVKIIKKLKEKRFLGKFILISQVENKDMIATAFEAGIDYYILKPINKIEVLSIIKKVIEVVNLENSINYIKKGIAILENDVSIGKNNSDSDSNILYMSKKLNEIFNELGIIGELGTSDLQAIIEYFFNNSINIESFALNDIYKKAILNKKNKYEEKEIKAMEQRIRRLIHQTLDNLAAIGVTDYSNPIFEYYAPKLFDFHEVRAKMREIENNKKKGNYRINIRKFILAIYTELEKRI